MSDADRALWQATQRRAAQLAPRVGLALLAAYAVLRDALSDTEIARAIDRGGVDELLSVLLREAVLATAFQPVRERIRDTLNQSARSAIRHVPVRPRVTPRDIVVAFDTLNPRVIDAVRTLESRVITELVAEIRTVVRAFTENGLRDGRSPLAIARTIRPMIGVPPSREVWIANYRAALRAGRNGAPSTAALGYELRDRRFDITVKSAIKKGARITAAQEETMVTAMRRRTIAFSANTVARTATLDALRLGQRLSWEAAAEQGYVVRADLMRQRIGVDDERERPEHRAINNEVRQFDEPYSNGELVAGDHSYQCRCVDRYYLATPRLLGR